MINKRSIFCIERIVSRKILRKCLLKYAITILQNLCIIHIVYVSVIIKNIDDKLFFYLDDIACKKMIIYTACLFISLH